MRARAPSLLVLLALVLLGTSCGGAVCVGYGCYYVDPCYPWCPYEALINWDALPVRFPFAATAADFDGDGTADLVVLDDSDGLAWFAGGPSAAKPDTQTFVALAAAPEPRRILPGHLDGDGLLDLVVVGRETGTVEVLLGNGDGRFVPAVPSTDLALAPGAVDVDCAALDDDAFDDLVVLRAEGRLAVYRGDGAGGFLLPEAAIEGVGAVGPDARIVCADLDRLPGVDVAVVLPARQQVHVLSSRGDGTFDSPQVLDAQIPDPLLDATWCVGRSGEGADLVLLFPSTVDEDHRLVRLALGGVDAGLLEDATTGARHATQVETADLTGDGLPDLVLVDEEAGTVEVLRAVP